MPFLEGHLKSRLTHFLGPSGCNDLATVPAQGFRRHWVQLQTFTNVGPHGLNLCLWIGYSASNSSSLSIVTGSFMFLGIGKYDWSPYAEVNDFLISLLEMVVVMALLSEPEMIPTLILLFCCIFQKIVLELFLLRFLWWLSIPSEGRGGGEGGRACQPCCRGCSSGRTPFPSLNLNFMTF